MKYSRKFFLSYIIVLLILLCDITIVKSKTIKQPITFHNVDDIQNKQQEPQIPKTSWQNSLQYSYIERISVPYIVTKRCYDNIMVQNLTSHCIRMALSKCLGYGIVIGSFLLKQPQIFAIIISKSVKGQSLYSQYLEIATMITTALYNYYNDNPISTYAESIVITQQNIFIVGLFWYFENISIKYQLQTIIGFIVYTGIHFIVPDMLFNSSMIFVTILTLLSKQKQILYNYKKKSTGVLSILTCGLQFLGSCARVFTTFNDIDDIFLLISSLISCFLNAFILSQIFYYSYLYRKVPTKSTKNFSKYTIDSVKTPNRLRPSLKSKHKII